MIDFGLNLAFISGENQYDVKINAYYSRIQYSNYAFNLNLSNEHTVK